MHVAKYWHECVSYADHEILSSMSCFVECLCMALLILAVMVRRGLFSNHCFGGHI